MKYRIIIGTLGTNYPYRVQAKKDSIFSLWTEILCAESSQEAEVKLRNYIRSKLPPEGTVVKVYDESDLIVDKLKGVM